MNFKKTHFIFLAVLLVAMMSVAVAADVNDSTESVTTPAVTHTTDNTDVQTATPSNEITKKVETNIEKENYEENTRGTIHNINNTNFDDYITASGLTSLVNGNDTLNFTSDVTRTNSSYTINKSINITGNGFTLDLNTTSGSYMGNETGNLFNIINTGSYTNITNINFHNTQIFVKNTTHVTFDNVNITVNNQRIGSGVGVLSIRENSTYVTVKNSYIHTCNNSGSSSIVLAQADYCTIDNNTIIGEGNVGNLVYLTTYNIPNVLYTDVNTNTYNNITNNRISTINLSGGVCVGVVVSGHSNKFEGNNVSVTSSFSGQWISPTANLTGDFNDTYEGNSYINNKVYGSFTGTKNSTITDNKFNKTVSLPERCIFKNNNAENFTVTIKGSNCDLCGNRIYHLTVNSGVTNTRVCRDNVFINGYEGSFTWYTHPTSLGLLNKKSIQQVKTEGEPTVITITEENYSEWFKWNEKTLKFVSESTGAKTFYIEYLPTNMAMLDLYNWYSASWDTSQYTFIGQNNFNLTNVKVRAWGANVLISNMTLYYDEDYENYGDSNSYYIFIESDHDFIPSSSFVLDNIKINYTGKYLENYHSGVLCTGEYQPGVTYQNIEINAKMLSVPNGNELVVLERNDKFINSTVTIVEDYATSDETSIIGIKVNKKSVEIKDNNITLNGESTLIAIKLDGNNNTITNNNITVTTTGTATGVELNGNDNTVTDNYIVANDKKGDAAVTATGENNVVKDNMPLSTSLKVIAPATANIRESTPITIMLKDSTGKLMPAETITVKAGDNEAETVTTDEDGIAVYNLTATASGELNLTITFEDSGAYAGATQTVTINVNEDKDAIIEELNNTINTQAETIESLNNTIQQQNATITQLNETINTLTETTTSQAETIETLNNTIQQQNATITQLNETINTLTETTTSQAETIESLNNTIQEQNATITQLNETINTLTETTTSQAETIESLNNTIQEQNATITQLNETINTLTETTTGQAETIESLNNTVQEQRVTIDELNATVGELNATAQNQAQTIDALNDSLHQQADMIESLNDTVNSQASAIESIQETLTQLQNTITELTTPKDTILTIDPLDAIKYNSEVTVKGKLSDNETNALKDAYVVVKINGVETPVKTGNDGSYTFTTTINKMSVGDIKVAYEGSDKYNPSDASTPLTVEKADCIISIDQVTDKKYNDELIVTGTFTDSNGLALKNSAVTITINDKIHYAKTDNNGVYTLTTKANTVGQNNITAGYRGNKKYNAYTTDTITFNVEKADCIITVDTIPDATYKDTITITGTFKTATGTALKNSQVNIYINGAKYTAKTDDNGVYTYTTKATAIGENTVTVSYNGNGKYNAYTTEATTFNVAKKDTTITMDTVTVDNGKISITGTFKDNDGTALKNSNVVVYINNAHYTVKTDDTGAYTFTGKANGTATVNVAYMGNARYNAYTSPSLTITV